MGRKQMFKSKKYIYILKIQEAKWKPKRLVWQKQSFLEVMKRTCSIQDKYGNASKRLGSKINLKTG